MKASLKFREEQKKPLFRAKVPISVLGMPFQSGIVAGDSKELTLNLATFFQSGPSIRASYRPNDSKNPFSVVVKTGTGPFGSPLSGSMLMSCEFNLLARNNGPLFMLHFKPRFGDFTFKKTQSSIFENMSSNGFSSGSDEDGSIEVVEKPAIGSFSAGKVPIFGSESPAAGAIASAFSGMEVAARTTLPVRGRAAVNFRWGVRVPADMKVNSNSSSSAFQRIPFLVMDKIGVELLPEPDVSKKGNGVSGEGSGLLPVGSDVAEACLAVKRQMEVLQAENGSLRSAVEDLRREIGGGSEFGKYREFEKSGVKGKNSDGRKNEKNSGFSGKSTESDVTAIGA